MRLRRSRRFTFLAAGLAVYILAAHSALAAMDNYPTARLRMLDKVTARTSTFDVKVDTTVRFGQLYIKPRACRKAPPIETPESASFLQVWEVKPKEKPQWVFSGWMFASSPALSSMDHPIYDVWVLDCIGAPDHPAETAESGQVEFSSASGVAFSSSAVDFASGGETADGGIDYSSSSSVPLPGTEGIYSPASGTIIYGSSGANEVSAPQEEAPIDSEAADSDDDTAKPDDTNIMPDSQQAPVQQQDYTQPYSPPPSSQPQDTEVSPSAIHDPVY